MDRVVLVTGASSGIGAATVRALVEAGARVGAAARRHDRLVGLACDLGENALPITADVTSKDDCERMVRETAERFGRVDALVANAGVMPLSLLDKVRVDEWQWMVDVNVKGLLASVGAVLPHMLERGSGHVVNVSSVAARQPFPGGAVYCATKAAVSMLSEGMRQELAPKGIRVTSIEPGAVATELGNAIQDDDVRRAGMERFAGVKVLDAEDVARAIVWCLDQPEHVNVAQVLVMPRQQGPA